MAASLRRSTAGLLAIAVALQHLGADLSFDLRDTNLPSAVFGVQQSSRDRINDGGLRPPVEFLHEALGLLFGHMFVPFGKPQCCGSGQLALLATLTVQAPG